MWRDHQSEESKQRDFDKKVESEYAIPHRQSAYECKEESQLVRQLVKSPTDEATLDR
jgi:hypothetical protein